MSGCFGGSEVDRWMQGQLDAHLDAEDEAEKSREAFDEEYPDKEEVGSDGSDLFQRDDGTRFRVVEWPQWDGEGWGSAKIEEETNFAEFDEIYEELAERRVQVEDQQNQLKRAVSAMSCAVAAISAVNIGGAKMILQDALKAIGGDGNAR